MHRRNGLHPGNRFWNSWCFQRVLETLKRLPSVWRAERDMASLPPPGIRPMNLCQLFDSGCSRIRIERQYIALYCIVISRLESVSGNIFVTLQFLLAPLGGLLEEWIVHCEMWPDVIKRLFARPTPELGHRWEMCGDSTLLWRSCLWSLDCYVLIIRSEFVRWAQNASEPVRVI